jgi:hypothetical protein
MIANSFNEDEEIDFAILEFPPPLVSIARIKAIFDAIALPTAAFVAGSVVTADVPEVDKKAARVAIRALLSAPWAALMNWKLVPSPIIGSNKTFEPISEKLPAAQATTIAPYCEPLLTQN